MILIFSNINNLNLDLDKAESGHCICQPDLFGGIGRIKALLDLAAEYRRANFSAGWATRT